MNRTAQDKMSEGMFMDIIEEICTWEIKPPHLCPFLTNEPFADNRIYDFCKLVNEYLPKTSIVFFTNGSLFTDANLDRLKGVQNISTIHVSLHHSNKTEYEADLGLIWEKTLVSVHRLIDRQRWPVKLLRVQSGDKAKDLEFTAFCGREFPGTPVQLSYRYNWKGDITSPFGYENTLDIICPRHQSLTILCDGRVSLCCLDESGEYSLGDFKKDRLIDIYNSPLALSYRTRVKRWSEPCSKCNHHA